MNFIADDTKKKLLEDPNAIETTILVNPEPLGEISPTLPLNFPSKLIPKENCQIPMAELVNCLLHNNFDNVKCENFQFNYYRCKSFRDSSLFSKIRNWECNEYKKLNDNEKTNYNQNLLSSKAKLLKEYDQTEINSKNKGYRKRIDHEIQQLNWRLSYLPKCLINI